MFKSHFMSMWWLFDMLLRNSCRERIILTAWKALTCFCMFCLIFRSQLQVQRHNRVQMDTKLMIKEDWTQIQQQLRRTWRKGMLHSPRRLGFLLLLRTFTDVYSIVSNLSQVLIRHVWQFLMFSCDSWSFVDTDAGERNQFMQGTYKIHLPSFLRACFCPKGFFHRTLS